MDADPRMVKVLRDGPPRWHITCGEHDLDRTVETEAHATNLYALHLRRDHANDPDQREPAAIDVTAAALAVLRTDRGVERAGALAVWQAMTGLTSTEALAYARAVSTTPTTAAVPPF